MEYGERFPLGMDKENGMVIGPDNCHYETEAEAMYFSLDLCGCGCPENVHEFLIDCAKAVQAGTETRKYDSIMAIEALIKNKPDVVAEFIGHFLSSKELTEHGSSVYGSWLTERGKQFVAIGPHTD